MNLIDAEELELLRKFQIIDQHILKIKSEAPPVYFLGHSITAIERNPNYSTQFFESCDPNGNAASLNLNEHLNWLNKELNIT